MAQRIVIAIDGEWQQGSDGPIRGLRAQWRCYAFFGRVRAARGGQAPFVSGAPPAYDYPFHDPYAATVLGVPPAMQIDYSSLPQPVDKTITLFEKPPIPEGFWYDRGLKYSELLQAAPAPLVYIIGGTGADSRSPTTMKVADLLYAAGFSVVTLPSPTHPDFVINASENFVPGRPTQDGARHLRADPGHRPAGGERSETSLTACWWAIASARSMRSLPRGSTASSNRSISAKCCSSTRRSIYTARSRCWIKCSTATCPTAWATPIISSKPRSSAFRPRSKAADALDFSNERALLTAYKDNELDDKRLATIIGMSFRLAAANMIFTADVMGHDGYIFPKNREFKTSTPLNHYMAVALRTNFKDYFDQIYTEKYSAANPYFTAQYLINEGDLTTLSGFISQHKNIGLITNADDVILGPGDYAALVSLFGDNAMTFPTGGHLGNITHPAVGYRIVEFLKQ